MSSVLVGMFDSQSSASKARDRLLGEGFSSSAVSMTGGSASMASPASGTAADEPHQEGAISHFFKNLFGTVDDKHDDKHDDSRVGYTDTYNEAFRRGSYGVSVTTADEAETDKAERILNDCGAVDIDEKAEAWRKEGWAGGVPSAAAGVKGSASTVEAGATRKLQEVEEELKVGKRAVARGGVRVFTRMTEVPVTETVHLREEHANVARKTVDRPATEADLAAFKEGSIEVREMSEEAVVSKSARVVGEVEVGKTATERDEVVRDTVRKTKVDVEQLDGSVGRGEPKSGAERPGLSNRDSRPDASSGTPLGTGVASQKPKI